MVKNYNAPLLLMLILGHVAVDLNQGALPALLPSLKDSLDLSYTQSAAILMAMTFSSSIIQPVFGYYSDRISLSWILPAGVLIAGLALACLSFVHSYWLILVIVFISGLGIAAYHPQGVKSALASSPKRVVAMSWFMLGGNFGFAMGPLVVLLAFSLWGQAGIVIFAVPALVVGTLLMRFNRRGTVNKQSAGGEPQAPQPLAGRIKPLSFLLGSVIMRSTVQVGFFVFMPFYLTSQMGWGKLEIAPVLTIYLIAGSVGTLLGGQLGQRIGPRRFFLLSIIVAAPVNFLFLQAETTLWLYVCLVFSAIAVMAPWSSMMVMGQDIMPDRTGMAAALMAGFSIGGGGLCATLLGLVADHTGIVTVMWVLVFLPLVSAVLGLGVPKSQEAPQV